MAARAPGTLVAAAVLLLVALGGGAYAAVTAFTGHPGVPGQARPSALAIGASASPAAHSSALPPASPPPASPASGAPASGPGMTTAPPAGKGAAPVAMTAPARANAAEPAVLAFVQSYFAAINAHDYQAYARLLSPGQVPAQTRARFDAGYSSTFDSAATLTGISGFGDRGEAAAITFTSRQDPAQSVTGADSCDHWAITLFLEPDGSRYVLGTAPPGYHARYQAC